MSFVRDDLAFPYGLRLSKMLGRRGVNGRKTTGTGSDVFPASVALNEPFDEDAE
jgi:hypothetical protein